ncbi:MAG: hypothetical protein K2L98_01175 [Bacilli bacterium]|nr:hypothetical protein [Bacilli bacterium]
MRVLVIIIHFLLTIIAWTSFLWLDWLFIAILSLAHIIMLQVGNGCFLSHYQFKDKKTNNTHFYEWWMSKLGLKNYNREKSRIFMTYIVPLIIVVLGIILQDILKIIVPII